MSIELVVLIVALAIAAGLFIWQHKRTSKVSAAVSSLPSTLTNVVSDLKAHVTREADAIKTRVATVGTVVVDKLGGDKTAKPLPVLTLPPEPSPPPAAPAVTEPVAPPPATVAPAVPPPAPAPTTAGGGTEPSLTLEPRAPIPDSTGPVPVTSLSLADLRFLWWATINPATPQMHNWEYTVLSGTHAQIQEDLATVGLNVAWLRHFDPTAYVGLLRPYYDAAVKA